MAATSNDSEIIDLLKNLEQRISRIESRIENLPSENVKERS